MNRTPFTAKSWNGAFLWPAERSAAEYLSSGRTDIRICASEDGYYYAEKQSEINETVGWLDELAAKISNSREGLIQSRLEEGL